MSTIGNKEEDQGNTSAHRSSVVSQQSLVSSRVSILSAQEKLALLKEEEEEKMAQAKSPIRKILRANNRCYGR